jgi:hypothetical protein
VRVVIHPPPTPMPLALTVAELAQRWGVPAADIEQALRHDRGLLSGCFEFGGQVRVGERVIGPLRAAIGRQTTHSPR